MLEGVGDACKLGSSWAGRVGEGFFLTYLHTWIRVPRWQPDKLFAASIPQLSFSGDYFRYRDLLWVLYMSEHISVNCCLSQGYLRFRMQLSLWDASVVSVKMFINHSGSPASFPILLSNSYFWTHDTPGCVTHWTTMNKTSKLSALLELTFWLKWQAKPKFKNTRPILKSPGGLLWVRWLGKTLPPQRQWCLTPVLSFQSFFLPFFFFFRSRNEHVNHYITRGDGCFGLF